MSATYIEPRAIRRARPTQPTIELNPHGLNVVGTQPLLSIILDMGEHEPAYIIKLPTDLQHLLHRKVGAKLPRSTT